MAQGTDTALVEAALAELLEWEDLQRSPQLGGFLRYVVSQTLAGDAGTLKAYSIAVDVFGRPSDFDPQTDPIVRVQAARLRSALDRFYESGLNQVPLRISIPVGRYVPLFEPVSIAPQTEPVVEVDEGESARTDVGDRVADASLESGAPEKELADEALPPRPKPNGRSAILVGGRSSALGWRRSAAPFLIMVGVVVLAVLVAVWVSALRWDVGPVLDQTRAANLSVPSVEVDGFENLSGLTELDSGMAAFAQQLTSDLSRFEFLRVRRVEVGESFAEQDRGGAANSYLLTGAMRSGGTGLELDIVLTDIVLGKIAWTQTLGAQHNGDDPSEIFVELSQKVSAVLGNYRGPLHDGARRRLRNADVVLTPSDYACALLSGLARDDRTSNYDERALACFAQLLEVNRENPIALAGWAALRSNLVRRTAPLGERLADQLFDETAAARHAVELSPRSAFVHKKLARVLDAQELDVQARRMYETALWFNPADTDIRAEYAQFLAYSGAWDAGQREMAIALQQAPNVPPWYYELHAFNDLRILDYVDAVADALRIARGDPEMGKVLALAAAPLAARGDLVERYLLDVLSDPLFQEKGILPRLSRRISDESVLQLLVPGLQLAGVPAKAINYPYGPEDYAGLSQ